MLIKINKTGALKIEIDDNNIIFFNKNITYNWVEVIKCMLKLS